MEKGKNFLKRNKDRLLRASIYVTSALGILALAGGIVEYKDGEADSSKAAQLTSDINQGANAYQFSMQNGNILGATAMQYGGGPTPEQEASAESAADNENTLAIILGGATLVMMAGAGGGIAYEIRNSRPAQPNAELA